MNLTQLRIAIRTELTDTADSSYRYTEDQLTVSIAGIVALMSRYLPRRRIFEKTIPSDVTGESITITSGVGYTAKKPVKSGSLTLADGGTTKTLDTDYSFDYLLGKVTAITLADGTYTVSYSVDKSMVYFGDSISDFMRVERVEYPVGGNPATFIPFEEIDNYIILKGDTTLSALKHMRVYYLARHSLPTATERGSYPTHLDQAVVIGSVGQILLMQANECLDLAMDYVDDVQTDIANMSTPIGAASTALNNIAAPITNSRAFLTTGTPLVNKPNAGDKVAENFASYAQMEANLAQLYLQESERRISVSKEYFNQANIKSELINKFMTLHQNLKAAGESKMNQFYGMMGIKPELPVSSVASQQAIS